MAVYNGDIHEGWLYPGDYITSPSGTYTAFLTSDVQFTVSRGSVPSTSASNVVWQTPPVNTFNTPGNAQAYLYSGGELWLFDPDISNGPLYTFPITGVGDPNAGATLSLADNGALTINSGRNPSNLGPQLFTNSFNDPVVGIGLSDINYDLSNPTIKTTSQVTGGTFKQTNNTAVTQTYPAGLTLNYAHQENWNFQLSEAITLGVKSTFDVGVPGIGDTSAEISLTETTTITGGHGASDTNTRIYTNSGNIVVPPFSTYETILTGTTMTYDIPFTFDGVVNYASGATALVQGTGVFGGADTGDFSIVTNCISTPGGCPTPPSGPAPIPEPASLSLLPVALLAAAAVRRLRAGHRLGARRGGAVLIATGESV